MNKKIGIGKAHSKIILMGEHSVVYGYPAIALPLKDIEVTCCIKEAQENLTFDFYDTLSTAIYAALDYLQIKEKPITYKIKSQVPQKRGMGSSANSFLLQLSVRFLIILIKKLRMTFWKFWSIRLKLLPILIQVV